MAGELAFRALTSCHARVAGTQHGPTDILRQLLTSTARSRLPTGPRPGWRAQLTSPGAGCALHVGSCSSFFSFLVPSSLAPLQWRLLRTAPCLLTGGWEGCAGVETNQPFLLRTRKLSRPP